MMHSPRVLQPVSDNGRVELTKPMQGALDEVLEKTGNNPVGFDITGSPFENLKESKTSHNDLSGSNTFKSICDGYIFLMPYHDYEALTWIPDFINEKNLLDVKKYFWSVNSELQIDSIDYANDLCSSVNSSLLKTAKAL
jgi:hypothetical protein